MTQVGLDELKKKTINSNQIQPATQNKILTQSNPTQKNKLEMLGWIELDRF